MEKIKNLLNPGKTKDDEVLYGNQGSSTTQSSAMPGSFNEGDNYNSTAHGSASAHDQSTNQPKEHGVLRQILNPGNEKYDPALYKGSDDVLATNPREGERIPGALATGSSAQPVHSGQEAEHQGGVMRQILNPGGDKYDGQGFEPTGTVGSGSSTNAPTYGSAGQTHGSHTGRDLAGAGAVGAGTGALAHHEAGRDRAYDQSTSGRSGPLDNTSSTYTAPQHTTTTTTTTSTNTSGLGSQGTTGYGNTGSQGTTGYGNTGSGSHHGAEAAAVGTGALAAGGLATHEHGQHSGNSAAGSGLSHHVHNSVTEPAHSNHGHHSFTGSRSGSGGHGTSSAYEPTQFHATPAATFSGAEQASGTRGVYNTVTGHGASESEHHHGDSGLGTAGTAGGTAGAALAAQEPMRRHEAQQGTAQYGSTTGQQSTAPYGSSTGQNTSSTATGPVHNSSLLNKLDPRVKTDPNTAQQGSSNATHHDSSHLGRDAAVGTGVGAGAYEAEKHHHGHGHGESSTTSQSTTGTSGPVHDSSLLNKLDPRVKTDSNTTQHGSSHTGQHGSSHLGRDAAIGTGVGAGAYEAEKHHHGHDGYHGSDRPISGAVDESNQPRDYTAGTLGMTGLAQHEHIKHEAGSGHLGSSQPYGTSGTSSHSTTGAAGPHSSSLLNKLDPRVKNDQTTTEPHHSHTGRDAALVGGAGAGAYEAEKHHGHHGQHSAGTGYGSTGTTGQDQYITGTAPGQPPAGASALRGDHNTSSTAGPVHNSSLLNKLDPRVKTDPNHPEHSSHTGRDAALVGGAGAGAYEAEKHHGHHGQHGTSTGTTGQNQYVQGTAPGNPPAGAAALLGESQHGTQHSHANRDAGLLGTAGAATGIGAYEAEKSHGHHGQHDSRTGSVGQNQYIHGTAPGNPPAGAAALLGDSHATQHSHANRDAGLLGTAGAATGVGAYEAEKSHGHHHDQTSGTSSSGVHHNSALLNKLDPRVKDTTTHDTQGTHQSHHGRDAAIGTGAGAATGAGVYEAEKHHGHHGAGSSQVGSSHAGYGTEQTSGAYTGYGSETTVPHHSKLMNKLDPRVPDDDATTTGTTHQGQHSHTGRDAALVGGAGAATGAGVYEAEKHHGSHGQTGYGQTGTGYDGQSGYGQTGTDYTGSGPATKTVGPHDSNVANVLDPRVKPQPEYQTHHTTTGQHDPSHTHTGRDAATGAGVGAGAGYAAHEHDKKHGHHHGPEVRQDEHGHNKLHKEKKEGFLHKLLHPGEKKHASEIDSPTGTSSTGYGHTTAGQTTDPHTGLPVNTQYGTGQGGTDATPTIGGYQQGSNVQGTDWDKVGKQNTPY